MPSLLPVPWAANCTAERASGAGPRALRSARGGAREALDLPERDGPHVLAGALSAVPFDDPLQGLLEVPRRPPAELALGASGVEREVRGLGRVRAPRRLPARARRPRARRAARRSSRRAAPRPRGGPKFQARAASGGARTAPAPAAGSRRAGSARAATGAPRSGLRTRSGLPLSTARSASGSSRSSPRSPPPITLPARAVATRGAADARRRRAPVGGRDELGARPSSSSTGRCRRAGRPRRSGAVPPGGVLVALVGGDDDDGANRPPPARAPPRAR